MQENPFIASEKANFGVRGGEYDWEGRDVHEEAAVHRQKKASVEDLGRTVNKKARLSKSQLVHERHIFFTCGHVWVEMTIRGGNITLLAIYLISLEHETRYIVYWYRCVFVVQTGYLLRLARYRSHATSNASNSAIITELQRLTRMKRQYQWPKTHSQQVWK